MNSNQHQNQAIIKLGHLIRLSLRVYSSFLRANHQIELRHEMAYTKIAVICAGALLLLTVHSSGNPLPARDPRHADSTNCRTWQLDTNSENDSVTQVSNGISAYVSITPVLVHGPVLLNETLQLVRNKLYSIVHSCRMHPIFSVLCLFHSGKTSQIYTSWVCELFVGCTTATLGIRMCS